MVDIGANPGARPAQRRTALVVGSLQMSATISIAPLEAAARFALRIRPETAIGLVSVAGFALDTPVNTCVINGTRTSARLGPDEWLLLELTAQSETLNSELEAGLGGEFASLVDISHRNVSIAVAGKYAREVINGACPLDLRDSAFPPGSATGTLFGKAEIVLLRPTEESMYRVECWRSFAHYVNRLLKHIAREFEAS